MKYSEEVILSKVLNFKHSATFQGSILVDQALETDEAKKYTKNVCAKLTNEMVESMENTCSILGISKREFIQLAVSDLLDTFDDIASEYDMFGPHEAMQKDSEKGNV